MRYDYGLHPDVTLDSCLNGGFWDIMWFSV